MSDEKLPVMMSAWYMPLYTKDTRGENQLIKVSTCNFDICYLNLFIVY